MIHLKKNTKEALLKQKVSELEDILFNTQKELQKSSAYNEQLESILLDTSPTRKSKIITIKSATKIEFVNVDHIIYCTADESYTHIELRGNKTITAAKPLSSIETILKEHSFFRISKSHLINTDFVVTFYKDRNQIVLQGDVMLDVARRRRVDFLKMLR